MDEERIAGNLREKLKNFSDIMMNVVFWFI